MKKLFNFLEDLLDSLTLWWAVKTEKGFTPLEEVKRKIEEGRKKK